MKARMLRVLGILYTTTQMWSVYGIDSQKSTGITVPTATSQLPTELQGRGKNKKKGIVAKSHMHRLYTDMSFEELLAATEKKIALGDFHTVLKYYEQLLKISTDINKTAELMIAYADLLFEQGELKKARAVYTEFAHLYPGHAKFKHAQKRALLCSFYLTLSADRDQSMTQETLVLTKEFLATACDEVDRKEVVDIQKQCYKKIAESEIGVCDFYLKQGSYKAVEQRLAHIKKEYLEHVPSIESSLLAMELELSRSKEQVIKAAQHVPDKKHASRRF